MSSRGYHDGLRFHYVEAGTGPVVLLLHGFQDFWYSWRFQIPALTAAGFHVVAPDLQGYNLSAKPAGIHQYRIELLAEDIVGLVHVVGEQRTVIVGHDWGGVIGWKIAHDTPELVQKLIILNAPHPFLFRQALRTFSQLWKSRYVFFFQLPWLPEVAIRACDYTALRCVLRAGLGSTPAFSENEILAYKAALAQPGALTARPQLLQGFGSIPVAQRPGGERDGHAANARRLRRTRPVPGPPPPQGTGALGVLPPNRKNSGCRSLGASRGADSGERHDDPLPKGGQPVHS